MIHIFTLALIASAALNIYQFRCVVHDIELVREIVHEHSQRDRQLEPHTGVDKHSASEETNGSAEISLLQEISDLRQHILVLQDEIRELKSLSASLRHGASRELRCTVLPAIVQQEVQRILLENTPSAPTYSNLLNGFLNATLDRISKNLLRLKSMLLSGTVAACLASLVVIANLIWLFFAAFSNGSKIYANFRLTLCACFGKHEDLEETRKDDPVERNNSFSPANVVLPKRTSPVKAPVFDIDQNDEHTDSPQKIHNFNPNERKCVPLRNRREKRMVMFLKHFQTPPNPDSKDVIQTCRTVKVLYPGKDYCFTIENYAMVEDLWAVIVYEDSETAFCLNAAYDEEHFTGWCLTQEGVLVNGEIVGPWKGLSYSTADQVRTKVEHHLDGAAAGAPTTISIGTHFR